MPALVVFFTVRRTSAQRSLRVEAALCIVLIVVVILTWASFVTFLRDISDEVASLKFIRGHLALGESPEFVLGIAGEGIAQPLDAIITWRGFQWGTGIAGIMLTLLAWLGARLWRAGRVKSK
jgi:ABC-type microcin C transport system permease subunit YejE